MGNINTLIKPENILNTSSQDFESIAIQLFHHQYENNVLYHQYCDALHIDSGKVTQMTEIPFLPISFFKTHEVKTGSWAENALVFESSATTGNVTSKHFVKDAALYKSSLLKGFYEFYGAPEDHVFLALLPSYLERKNASLVYMARHLMEVSGHAENGFYINEWQLLKGKLQQLIARNQKVILLGVTFALLDFATAYPLPLHNVIVMETGGMKGRHEECTRQQVHDFLKKQWSLNTIHSEYGMTELLSQAYATDNGLYRASSTMRAFVRDINDPLDVKETGTGCMNIIDIANIDSCCFIATEDIGIIHNNKTFEILGRMDHTALRGCSLMAV